MIAELSNAATNILILEHLLAENATAVGKYINYQNAEGTLLKLGGSLLLQILRRFTQRVTQEGPKLLSNY